MRKFFININKSGGAIVGKALGLTLQHVTAKEFISEFGEEEWENGFSFTFVRNPWDKALALYNYRMNTELIDLKQRSIAFDEWIARVYRDQDPEYYNNPRMFMPQVDWLTDHRGQVSVDRIAKFENLEVEFRLLCKQFEMEADLPERQSSNRPDYRGFYSEESAAIINDWFARDIEHFDYKFE